MTNYTSRSNTTKNMECWKIVEVGPTPVTGKPELHMNNPSRPSSHTTCCGLPIQNNTMIPPDMWHHDNDEYRWCPGCELKIPTIAKSIGVALPKTLHQRNHKDIIPTEVPDEPAPDVADDEPIL